MRKTYSYDEAFVECVEYFGGDELAAKVFVDKYALRDNNQNLVEKTPADMHRRLAKEFAKIEKTKFKKPLTEDEIFQFFDHFNRIIPGGSAMSGIGNPFQIVSLSNCFGIESPYDSYGGILKTDEEIVQISKRRGGVGADISELRPDGTMTHNAAKTSTGAVTFMRRFSNSAREVAQNGRRGAEMLSMSIHHPDCVRLLPEGEEPKMITIKGTDGEADREISTEYYNPSSPDFVSVKQNKADVTGANISVRISDEFMKAALAGKEFEQRWPCESKNPRIRQKINAAKAWDKLVYNAWSMAEPGILFWDNIINESVSDCYAEHGFKTVTTNPCGELPLNPYDSCRLLSLNLWGYIRNPFTAQAYFDYKAFAEDAKIAQRLMDDLVDLELEAVSKIIEKVQADPEPEEIKAREISLWQKVFKTASKGRRTGTGLTALGDVIAGLGIKYASPECLEVVDKIYKTMKLACYRSSVDMAKELGAFPIWDFNLEKNNPFTLRIKEEDAELYGDMKRYGRRNISLLTSAPTGSLSIVTQTTSGIEPLFKWEPYIRRKKINPNDKNARIDYVDQNGDAFQEFAVYHPKIKLWKELTGEVDDTKNPYVGSTANELNWIDRVSLQATAQKHIDNSISSTINLPSNVSVAEVKAIYEAGWKAGCKGLTVYRDGCRSGILVSNSKKETKIPKTNAPKRPTSLPCDVHHIKVTKKLDKVRSFDYLVIVGLMEGEPYEVFAMENGTLDKNLTQGNIIKRTRGSYDLVFDDGTKVKDVTKSTTENEDAVTRMTSTSLRHGADIAFVVQQLEKVEGETLSSFSKAIARALKKYIKDGTKVTGQTCPNCQSNNLERVEGCIICRNCGSSKCG